LAKISDKGFNDSYAIADFARKLRKTRIRADFEDVDLEQTLIEALRKFKKRNGVPGIHLVA
jgi:hypothetical protein